MHAPVGKRPRRIAPSEVVFENPPLARRHWLGVAGIIAAAAVAALWYTARTTAVFAPDVPPAALMDSARDEFVHCYGRAVSPDARNADILILGASSVRDALWPETVLSDALVTAGGPRRNIVLLTSGDQTFLEGLFLLDLVGLREGQTVVLFFGPPAFGPSEFIDQRLRYGAWLVNPLDFAERFKDRVPRLAEWLTPLERRNIAFQVQRKMLNRLVRRWAAGHVRQAAYGEPPVTFDPSSLHLTVCGNLEVQERHRQEVRQWMRQGFGAYSERVYRDLCALGRFARSRGVRFVTVESPMLKEDEQRTFGPWWERYRRFLRRFEDELGTKHQDFRHRVPFDTSHFCDSRHVGEKGRDLWSREFIVWLAGWLREAEPR